MKIESTDQDIRALLASAYYRIPRFQRPYSWDRENIQEFWDDIIRGKPSDYFIGSMVVYKHSNDSYGIVDGQQRLTTITVLLCVLRDKLGELGFQDLAKGVHGLVERRNIDNKKQFILSTESSYPFFQDHIQKWGEGEVQVEILKEEENLNNAYTRLKSLVEGAVQSIQNNTTLTKTQAKKQLRECLTTIRDALLDLKLIFIKLDAEDDAYVIFETLNTRGKDLSLTDLVKNHLAKHLKSKSASLDHTKIKWETMLNTIEGSSVDLESDTFTHHFWLSKYDYLPVKKVFKTLKKKVTKSRAGRFLDELVEDAGTYRTIHEPRYGKLLLNHHRIVDALEALLLFRVRQQTPCVLSLVRSFKEKKIKKKHLEDALVAIEKFHFLFTAVTSQRSSGGISKMYAALGRDLTEAKDTQQAVTVIRLLKKKLRDRVPSLAEVKALFPYIIYTENVTKHRKLVKYVLASLDRAQGSGGVVHYERQTIEHLVPQSVIGSKGRTDSVIGQLGNLILVSDDLNAKLKDKPFADKIKILDEAGVPLPEVMKKKTEWSPKAISDRTKRLAEEAYDSVWKI